MTQTRKVKDLVKGDVVVLPGSTITVEYVTRTEGLAIIGGLWEAVWGSEDTDFPFAEDAEVEVRAD